MHDCCLENVVKCADWIVVGICENYGRGKLVLCTLKLALLACFEKYFNFLFLLNFPV